MYKDALNYAYVISCIILICYGFRLGGFLALRELNNKTYIKKMKNEIKDGSNMNFGTALEGVGQWVIAI